MSIDKLSEEFPRLLKVMYSPSRELDKAITAICKAITKEAEKDIKDKDMDEIHCKRQSNIITSYATNYWPHARI